MTQPRPVTITGRQVRVSPPPAPVTPPMPNPHRLRRCHWVTVAARRIPADSTLAAVPQMQILQSCVHGCGRHRTRILPGHWQPRDLVHPSTLPPQRATIRTEVGDLVQNIELHGRDLARAVARAQDDRTARA